MEKITIEKFINEAKYDRMGQKIWGVDKKGGHQMIVDVRGWGAIQNLFIDKTGKVDEVSAGKFQDDMGQFIADAINEKIKNKSNTP